MLAKHKWQIRTIAVLERVFERRVAQVAQWGLNDSFYDGTGPETRWTAPITDSIIDVHGNRRVISRAHSAVEVEQIFRRAYEAYEEETGQVTWVHLVLEEVAEAFKESDPDRLAHELLDVAALCVSWVEQIDQRGARPVPEGLI